MKFQAKSAGRFLFTLIIVLLLTPAAVFAADGKTVEVSGYAGEGLDSVDLSVSNVTATLDAKSLEGDIDAYFTAQSPAVITVLNDAADFSVFKVAKEDSADTVVGEPLPFSSGQLKMLIPTNSETIAFREETIDATELQNFEGEYETYTILKGSTVTLTEPGDYHVTLRYEALAGSAEVLISVEGDSTPVVQPPAAPSEAVSAVPTASKVLVNGIETSFDAYNINGNNYFKLRDLAKVVSGTEKQFEVGWDAEAKVIDLISGQSYTEVGGELASGDGQAKNAVLNTSKIYKDGSEAALTAYNINGNNYFKLRDLASAFNIGVTWDDVTKTVGIDTTLPYIEE